MNKEEEDLFEMYFDGKGINSKLKDLCLNAILNSKELTCSVIDGNKFDVASLYLTKQDIFSRVISFQGIIENDNESRYISGTIINHSGRITLNNVTVSRIESDLSHEESYISYDEIFTPHNGGIYRDTMYHDKEKTNERAFMPKFNKNELELFKKNKVEKIKKLSKKE